MSEGIALQPPDYAGLDDAQICERVILDYGKPGCVVFIMRDDDCGVITGPTVGLFPSRTAVIVTDATKAMKHAQTLQDAANRLDWLNRVNRAAARPVITFKDQPNISLTRVMTVEEERELEELIISASLKWSAVPKVEATRSWGIAYVFASSKGILA